MYRGKNAVNKFMKSILREYNYCKKIMKKYFNKNLVMTAEENERFEMTNICWICDRLIDINDNKAIIVILLVNIEEQHIMFVILI